MTRALFLRDTPGVRAGVAVTVPYHILRGLDRERFGLPPAIFRESSAIPDRSSDSRVRRILGRTVGEGAKP